MELEIYTKQNWQQEFGVVSSCCKEEYVQQAFAAVACESSEQWQHGSGIEPPGCREDHVQQALAAEACEKSEQWHQDFGIVTSCGRDEHVQQACGVVSSCCHEEHVQQAFAASKNLPSGSTGLQNVGELLAYNMSASNTPAQARR